METEAEEDVNDEVEEADDAAHTTRLSQYSTPARSDHISERSDASSAV